MGAEQFRKRPLPVQGFQLGPDNGAEVAKWCGGELAGDAVLVPTMRGQLPAFAHDWVMNGTHSEYYPIGPDVKAKVCMTDAELLEKIRDGLDGLPLSPGDMTLTAMRIFTAITADAMSHAMTE